jgi:type III pantothenate kinase
MKLLLDAGNTRLKWGLQDGTNWLAQGVLDYAELSQLANCWLHYGLPQQAWIANVAGEAVHQSLSQILQAWQINSHWLRPQAEQCGIINRYHYPERLGADRWAALIGARSQHSGPCLVVTAGTATTVDLLSDDNQFLGGCILPGLVLMQTALARNTAQLPQAQGVFTLYPRQTDDAIVSGCIHAQVGAIERMFQQIASQAHTLCLLNGGAAPLLAPHLNLPWRLAENLVLEGLAQIAGCHGES